MTGVLLRVQPHEDRAQATPGDYEDRDRSPTATSQEMHTLLANQQKLRRRMDKDTKRILREHGPGNTLISGF